jgi:hypothetical protein
VISAVDAIVRDSKSVVEAQAREVVAAMTRAGQSETVQAAIRAAPAGAELTAVLRDALISEVRAVLEADTSFAEAVSALRPLAEATPDVVGARRMAATRAGAPLSAVLGFARTMGNDTHAAVLSAIEEAGGSSAVFPMEPILRVVEEIVASGCGDGTLEERVRTAVGAAHARRHQGLEKVRCAVDVARGYAVLDDACAHAKAGSALEVFAVSWTPVRTGAPPGEVDAMAAAIAAGDVAKLGELIGGADAGAIRVNPKRLPVGLRRPARPVTLLEIAAAVGGASLRYLLEFFGLKTTGAALHQAVASGNPETIRLLWERLEPGAREVELGELALTAADFHHVEVAIWLLLEARPVIVRGVRNCVEKAQLFDILLRLPAPARPGPSGLLAERAREVEQLEIQLGNAVLVFDSSEKFDGRKFRGRLVGIAQTLLLVQGESCTFGAFVGVPWQDSAAQPRLDGHGVLWRAPRRRGQCWTMHDGSGLSFLFVLDGPSRGRFPVVNIPDLGYGPGDCLTVGELELRLKQGAFESSTYSSSWGDGPTGRFPAMTGERSRWEIWAL